IAHLAGALRCGMDAPQANRVYVGNVVLEHVDIVNGLGVHAPVICVSLECSQLPIDQSPEAHITVKRYEELTRWVEIFHPVVDIFDRLEVARLAGKRCALFKSRGIDRKLLPSRARRYP